MSRTQESKARAALTRGHGAGGVAVARIHAGAATREHRRAVSLLTKAAEADVIYHDLAAARATRDSTRSLAKASRALEGAGRAVNVERTLAVARGFVERSQEVKVAGAAVEGAVRDIRLQQQQGEGELDGGAFGIESGGLGEEENETERLMERLADEAGVELRSGLETEGARVPGSALKEGGHASGKEAEEFEDGLAGRLRALRA